LSVSYENSKAIFAGIKAAGIRSVSALPETWLIHLLQRCEDDPELELVEVAKEEEAIAVAAGAYLAGKPHLLLTSPEFTKDAKPRLSGGDQRHRLAGAAL
jgi:sulfopyruvate decarboxylase subunit alpha